MNSSVDDFWNVHIDNVDFILEDDNANNDDDIDTVFFLEDNIRRLPSCI